MAVQHMRSFSSFSCLPPRSPNYNARLLNDLFHLKCAFHVKSRKKAKRRPNKKNETKKPNMFVKENMPNRWVSISSAAARNTNEGVFITSRIIYILSINLLTLSMRRCAETET